MSTGETVGTVHAWHDEEGWGTISSPDLPGLCWAHFSEVQVPGYRRLAPGESVTFRYERSWQDGHDYVACEVWPAGADRSLVSRLVDPGPSAAYRSGLAITFDEGTSG